jgi:hypothetical protein
MTCFQKMSKHLNIRLNSATKLKSDSKCGDLNKIK